jgi:hypothetical protein
MPWKKKRKHRHSTGVSRMPRLQTRGCGCFATALLLAIVFIVLLTQQWTFLRHRFVTYPHLADAMATFEDLRRPKQRDDGLTDLRGVFHAHSLLSHDSMGTPAEIVRGAQLAKIDFVFLTDHPATPPKDVPAELQGQQGGITLIPGVETSQGMLAWFFDTRTVDPKASLAEQIAAVQAVGGMAAVCHPDEPRPWDNLPPFDAMEIYNLHADAKKTRLTMGYRLGENFWSMSRYPMQVFYGLFHDPEEYVALWDHQTVGRPDETGGQTGRRVVAIAGNDAHQNNGLRLVVSPRGTLVLTDTGPKISPMMEWNNWLARRYIAGHREGETLWRWDADLYERSFRFVNTHLLAVGRTPQELRAAFQAGHAYVAFDSLVTATGFDFSYRFANQRALMGDEAPLTPQGVLNVEVPISAVISLKRNGVLVADTHDSQLHYTPKEPGVYRVEVLLDYDGNLLRWIYSNPIYLK